MQLRPYQQTGFDECKVAHESGVRNVLFQLPTGGGKCLGKGTRVLLWDGTTRKVEDVKIGDRLIGPDSKPRTVLSVCRGFEPLYKVVPIKGEPYVVNESHVLSLKQTGLRKNPTRPCEAGKGQIVNIEVRDYLAKSNNFKHTHKGWRCGVMWRPNTRIASELPAYFLGLWLGDGTSRGASITSEDFEVLEYVRDLALATGQDFRVEDQPNNASKVLHLSNRWQRSGTTLQALRKFSLLQNKHIPVPYLRQTRRNRLELLAGLIDSDGSLGHSGYDIVQKSRKLAEDIVFLCRSLGFAAYLSPCRKTCTNNGVTGPYYRVSISGDLSTVPVRLGRKSSRKRRQIKSVLVTGIKLEPLGLGEYFGFEITGDRLFLLADFTVTHNTVIFSEYVRQHNGPSCAIAHRQELVTQMSLALARDGVRHRIIGPASVVKLAVRQHMDELGRAWYDPDARCAVAGVDTLVRQADKLARWRDGVTLWVTDECHHLLRSNKWGKAAEMFPNAVGLGVTATPIRADGKGLGRHADGVFDCMIEGPSMRELIGAGYLTDYRIFAPPSDLDLSGVKIGATGDYVREGLVKAVRKSKVVGDVVAHYLRIASGKLGVTFATDVETATTIAGEFNAAGVSAAVVSAKTPDAERIATIARFRRRELLQLVNVDLFGEGFDLPAIEVVSMARPTQSYALYSQQFGRALRLLDGKDTAYIIDHVGNVIRHGLPDAPREWSLDRRESRGSKGPSDAIPLRSCPECAGVYERVLPECPYCGHHPVPTGRSGPEFVDGDLNELDAETLAAMRGQVANVDQTDEEFAMGLLARRVPDIGRPRLMRKHAQRRTAQAMLRLAISWWAGWQQSLGRSDSESYRRFYHNFGVDVLTAQTLGEVEAMGLAQKIEKMLLTGESTGVG